MILSVQTTRIGTIALAERDGCLTNLYFEHEIPDAGFDCSETALTAEAFRQLQGYLNGELTTFSLPLAPAGTPFMQRVWHLVSAIPYGETASYKNIAAAAGNHRAVRAVGMANHRNPLPIFIPCHRVIGSNGSLTGYRGGLSLKRQLLGMEKGV